MAGKYQLTTLGCKVNQYESQQIREVLESFGLGPAGPGDVPDVAVVNTCAVTTGASRKSRQAIRRLGNQGRTPVIVVGCGVSAEADRLRNLLGVTALLGHDVDVFTELHRLLATRLEAGFFRPAGDAKHTVVAVQGRPEAFGNEVLMKPDAGQGGSQGSLLLSTNAKDNITPLRIVKKNGRLAGKIRSFAGRQRAFLKVQDGCDAFCSYCIIPRLRPQLRSKPVETAVAEARDLVRAGHREIIVTGVFLGAYGRETALRNRWRSGRSPLSALVTALTGVEGLTRVRLSSLEPGDVDESLLDVLASHESCVPHLHLPLQSGSADVLRRMNRQYTRDEFEEMIDLVRSRLDRPAITTDIIVGFPGESDEDFERSIEMARRAQFCKIHAFPYSPRDKTAASRWRREFVSGSVVRERMRRLAEVETECSLAFRTRFVGQTERVIVEEPHGFDQPASVGHPPAGLPDAARTGCREPHGARPSPGEQRGLPPIHHGRADRYFEIHFEANSATAGDVVQVRIDRVTPTRTHGTCTTSERGIPNLAR